METINLAIFRYFKGGFTYTEIVEFLQVRHGYGMSLSTLKRWLREKGMRKRPLKVYEMTRLIYLKLLEMNFLEMGRQKNS